jgi:hypothetical protein
MKAKQDAYDKVIQRSEEFLQEQRRDYEAQSARMLLAHKAQEEQRAREDQRVMEMIQAESDRMMAEASQSATPRPSLPLQILPLRKSHDLKIGCMMSPWRSACN